MLIYDKLKDSWQKLFATRQMSDIPLHDKPTATINQSIIFEIICKNKLTLEQINRIEKASTSKLHYEKRLREIDLTTQEAYFIYAYEFIGLDSKTPNVLESWLKD